MIPAVGSERLSVDEYLASEDGAELRHEYIGGEVYAMTGATARHGLITLNMAAALRSHVRGSGCQLFANDMKVRLRIGGDDIFYYPDILLSCDPADRAVYFRESPCLIVEVLSESTERLDRREKFFAYQRIPSLREYVLVAQDRCEVQVHRRSSDWAAEVLTEGMLRLECLDVGLSLDDIYEDVD